MAYGESRDIELSELNIYETNNTISAEVTSLNSNKLSFDLTPANLSINLTPLTTIPHK